jgi:hypothetical protein
MAEGNEGSAQIKKQKTEVNRIDFVEKNCNIKEMEKEKKTAAGQKCE